jgi:hypothetical protein
LPCRGELRIAEVKSRIADLERFVELLTDLGFELQALDVAVNDAGAHSLLYAAASLAADSI